MAFFRRGISIVKQQKRINCFSFQIYFILRVSNSKGIFILRRGQSMKCWRFSVNVGSGPKVSADDKSAFEIKDKKIITYSVSSSGFFRSKYAYQSENELVITDETKIRIWSED